MTIVYSLSFEVIGILQILTLCLILASGLSQKKTLIIKKYQSLCRDWKLYWYVFVYKLNYKHLSHARKSTDHAE